MNRVEIKARAKQFAFSNKWNIWKPMLVVGLITGVVGFILVLFGMGPEVVEMADGTIEYKTTTVGSLINILLIPLTVGMNYYIINLVRGKKLEIKEIFSKYKLILPILVI